MHEDFCPDFQKIYLIDSFIMAGSVSISWEPASNISHRII